MSYDDLKERDANPDPITGEPGSHPVGVGVGAAAGAASGVAIGAAAGPVGSLAGAVTGAIVGGVAGGFAGKGIAELVNPTEVDAYWSENYRTRPYVTADSNYDTYRPAYLYGSESYGKYRGKRFNEVESNLKADWEKVKAKTSLGWEKAKDAVRDSYDWTYERDSEYRSNL